MGKAVVEFRPAVDGDGVTLEGGNGFDEGGVETITHVGEFSRGGDGWSVRVRRPRRVASWLEASCGVPRLRLGMATKEQASGDAW